MSSNIVYDRIVSLMPGNRKRSSSGWTAMNGVCCIHNGETPDTRQRLSIALGTDGISCIVSCFNCKFKAIWQPGQILSRKMRNFLGWLGMPDDDIKKLTFKIWQERERMKLDADYVPREIRQLVFPKTSLPAGSLSINQLLENGCSDPDFETVLMYLADRGDELLTGYDYYWSPSRDHDIHKRVIIPFYWKDDIVGWTARAAFDTKNRYHSSVPPNYLFNTSVCDNDWKFAFVCEGPFDAISINGIATLGDKITEEQILWLNQCGKTIIVIPDQVKAGGTLVDVAIKEGWEVAFPRWDHGIKDAADAVKAYGKLYTIWSIIDTRTKDKLSINVQRQRLK